MKKSWLVGIVLCGFLSFLMANPAYGCIGPDGKPIKGKDSEVTNCATAEEETKKTGDALEVSTELLDYGYLSEVGRSYTQTITLTNKSGATIAVKLSAEKPDSGEIKDESKLAAEWVAFVGGIKYFEIPANGTKVVGLRIMVPADATFGSQYATIKVEDVSNKVKKTVDLRLTVATEGVAFGGEVTKNSASPINLNNKINAEAVVKNGGNAGFTATYTLRVTKKFGLEDWKEIANETKEVYPGSETSFKSNSEEIGFGFFTIEQKITYINDKGEQVEEASTRTVLNLPLWAVIAANIVIVLIIVLLVVINIIKKKKAEDEEDRAPRKAIKEKKSKKSKASKKEKESIEIEM